MEESVEDQDGLRRILSLVMKQAKTAGEKKEKKVLIVDDDVDFLEMHSTVLTNRGYEVTPPRAPRNAWKSWIRPGPTWSFWTS